MDIFSKFDEKWGGEQNRTDTPKDILNVYSDILPDQLLKFWKVYGFSSFGNGLFWTVNPKEYDEVIKEWLDVSEYHPVVFMRNSFGGLLIWNTELEGIHYLNVVKGESRVLIRSVSMFMNRVLTDDKFIENDFLYDFHQKAYEKLGAVGVDECYAFEPAIAIGGDMDVGNITKRKTVPHLYLLSQVTEVVDLD
ncbi:GAD-like domain-containing protein [Rhodohalobacter sp. 8-1]|uniref:GAD-like domain-containing protein n=1 Tax=Rhodohalobacter sp. 8-1 TaxID=3131972 RepID=UPI0030EE7C5E